VDPARFFNTIFPTCLFGVDDHIEDVVDDANEDDYWKEAHVDDGFDDPRRVMVDEVAGVVPRLEYRRGRVSRHFDLKHAKPQPKTSVYMITPRT
jgi:hypothetical protein